MIQFNLLPDVKINYLKARRIRNIILLVSGVIVAACLLVIGSISLNVYSVQRNHISNITEDIDDYESQIKSIDEINKILTVQNQLSTVNDLHDEKPVSTRLFGYLEQVTPSDVDLSRVEVDMEDYTMTLSGQTVSLASVNRFVDTLKFTNMVIDTGEDGSEDVEIDTEDDENFAFDNVVLTSFSRDGSETSFVINLIFSENIFDSRVNVSLLVPERITTRSEVDRPSDLFQAPEVIDEEFDL